MSRLTQSATIYTISGQLRLIGNGRMTSQVLHFQVALSARLVYFASNTKRPNVRSERLSTGTSIC